MTTTKQVCVSIPNELYDFLEAHPELSPSKVLQQKIKDIKEATSYHEEKINSLTIKLQRMIRRHQHCVDFIYANGLGLKFGQMELKDD